MGRVETGGLVEEVVEVKEMDEAGETGRAEVFVGEVVEADG